MVATIRGWSTNVLDGTSNIALPAGTQNDDLLVLFAAQYVDLPSLPTSGGGTWDSRYDGSGASLINPGDQCAVRLSTKVKASGDGTVNWGVGAPSYAGAVMVALYDYDFDTFFTAIGAGDGGANILADAGTPAQAGKRLSFAGQVPDGPGPPTFTTPPNTTLGVENINIDGAYFRIAGYVDNADVAASSAFAARTVVSDMAGANVGVSFVVYDAAVVPAGPDPITNVQYKVGGVFKPRATKIKVGSSWVRL